MVRAHWPARMVKETSLQVAMHRRGNIANCTRMKAAVPPSILITRCYQSAFLCGASAGHPLALFKLGHFPSNEKVSHENIVEMVCNRADGRNGVAHSEGAGQL